jgi:N utilization substance protein A
VVPDDQLSLAIGREGQNARLAAKLTGWRIDIKSGIEAGAEAIRRAQEPEMAARLPETVLTILPTAEAVIRRHKEQPLPWNTEELQVLRQVVDNVHKLLIADREASRAAARAAAEAARAPKSVVPAEHAANVEAMLARIPPAAFETQLANLGLSARVFSHLEKARLITVGQVMQRLAESDEAMLSVEGIGPKALSEIKAQIEAKALSFLPEVTLAQPEVAAPVEAAAPAEVTPAEVTPLAAEAAVPAAEAVAAPVAQGAAPVEAATAAEVTAPGAEVVVPVAPLPPQLIEEALAEEVEFEEEEGGKGGKKKKKARTLVFDERLGTVVAQRKRKPGRQRDLWEVEE